MPSKLEYSSDDEEESLLNEIDVLNKKLAERKNKQPKADETETLVENPTTKIVKLKRERTEKQKQATLNMRAKLQEKRDLVAKIKLENKADYEEIKKESRKLKTKQLKASVEKEIYTKLKQVKEQSDSDDDTDDEPEPTPVKKAIVKARTPVVKAPVEKPKPKIVFV